MTYEEYMKIIPEAKITPGNEKEFEFLMNEFLSNAHGSCDRDELKKKLAQGPLVYDGMYGKFPCKSLKELVYSYYKFYKNTIDNPYIQNTMPPSYDPMARVRAKKG